MKVFISHKSTDSSIAAQINREFARLGVTSYLDVLDSFSGNGEILTAHIREQLNKCSDIIVVMSTATITSWWVPFEIGMSAQVDMPTATFLTSSITLPDYLSYWPQLKRISDIEKYVSIKKQVWWTDSQFENRTLFAKANGTSEFYRQLRAKL